MPIPDSLNAPSAQERLAALRVLAASRPRPVAPAAGSARGGVREVNCHVHTIYSFSPYSPAAAAECASPRGLPRWSGVDSSQ